RAPLSAIRPASALFSCSGIRPLLTLTYRSDGPVSDGDVATAALQSPRQIPRRSCCRTAADAELR
ncbi:unnamed protein product, partial [Urochloa humidicola]